MLIEYKEFELNYAAAIDNLVEQVDTQRGAIFASGLDYPGRYTCWDIGFYNPPLMLEVREHYLYIEALNARGILLLRMLETRLSNLAYAHIDHLSTQQMRLKVEPSKASFAEEERSKQPSIFTPIRELLAFFKITEDPYLGLYGAFGYDLIFQFEALQRVLARESEQRDLVLYLPDEIYVVDHRKEKAFLRRYDFQFQGKNTYGLAREGKVTPYSVKPAKVTEGASDHQPGEYAEKVKNAKQRFACGDLFEVVLSQTFYSDSEELPSSVFKRLCKKNPSPYGFFINLGEQEFLIGASPEMYVRVKGRKIETAPISGTIQRGVDAIEDAQNIQTLLDSEKEFSELTMCTDVDRNDKSRICEAGSVKVIGRRQIEMYSRVIHTVDHVEGYLRPEFDAIDAFLTHMWVVTVTGAPKMWAMNYIEQQEKSPRAWYGGAVGYFSFNGDLNTGLTLRTLRFKEGQVQIRVGATLLYDSIPEAEEIETQLKACAFLDILKTTKPPTSSQILQKTGLGLQVLLIDYQDSFVHTLANYLRQTGATVQTVRYEYALDWISTHNYDVVVLSPGPGSPQDFGMDEAIKKIISLNIPLFGVCLGLQGIVEYFGGKLGQLPSPMHGKTSTIKIAQHSPLFSGLDAYFTAGRYHSLYALPAFFPKDLEALAYSEDGIIMAITHNTLPLWAVQFHPETILSLLNQAGLKIITNLMRMVLSHKNK